MYDETDIAVGARVAVKASVIGRRPLTRLQDWRQRRNSGRGAGAWPIASRRAPFLSVGSSRRCAGAGSVDRQDGARRAPGRQSGARKRATGETTTAPVRCR